jgi:DNA mismatch repair protein MutS2
VLHELVGRGVQVLVTTHLEELKALGLADERFANARVGLDPDTLAPTFRLELGAAGVSSALTIAARVGLPQTVLERAKQSLHGGSALASALEKLESERASLEQQRSRYAELQAELEQAREALASAQAEAALARNQAEATVRAELRDELEAMRREAGEWVAKLTAKPTVKDAVETQRMLQEKAEEAATQLAKAAARGQALREAGPVPAHVRPGVRVKVVSLGTEAEVIEVGKDHAVVQAGILKTRVSLEELVALPGKHKQPASGPKRSANQVAAGAISGPELRCDVRGLRADDAMREVELFLDRTYSQGPQVALIVHGHGTGALKKAVREALEASPYVTGFRPGERHEGGDGVTVVELRT